MNNLFWLIGVTSKELPMSKKAKLQTDDSNFENKIKPNTKKSNFEGKQELLEMVRKLLAEGKSQSQIFSAAKAAKLGTSREVFVAVRFARANP